MVSVIAKFPARSLVSVHFRSPPDTPPESPHAKLRLQLWLGESHVDSKTGVLKTFPTTRCNILRLF